MDEQTPQNRDHDTEMADEWWPVYVGGQLQHYFPSEHYPDDSLNYFHNARQPFFSDLLAVGPDLIEISEPPHRVGHGVFRRHPRRDVVARPHLDVEPQLVLYLAHLLRAPNGRAQAPHNGLNGRHGESSFLRRL